MRVMVLGGCGAMGAEVTRDLAATSSFEEIVIADQDLPRAHALASECGQGQVRAVSAQAGDYDALVKLLRGFDVVANCTTYHFGLVVTRAAITAGVHYVDLGGLFNTPRQLELDEEARRAGVTICLGCGATPGLTNLLARYAASKLESVREVHIAFASFRSIAPSPGLLDTLLDEFSPENSRFYWEEGKFIQVEPFAGVRTVSFSPPVGPVEVYYVPHSETHTIPRFLGKGVIRVDVRGTWRPEIMAALRMFADFGLTSGKEVEIDGRKIASKEFLRSHILQHAAALGEAGEWAFLLNVEVAGEFKGTPVCYRYNTSHPDRTRWGTAVTGKMTGIPASIAAQKLAQGEAERTGVIAPEACFAPEPFLQALEERGIIVDENTTR